MSEFWRASDARLERWGGHPVVIAFLVVLILLSLYLMIWGGQGPVLLIGLAAVVLSLYWNLSAGQRYRQIRQDRRRASPGGIE